MEWNEKKWFLYDFTLQMEQVFLSTMMAQHELQMYHHLMTSPAI